jgi:hypothetical protein
MTQFRSKIADILVNLELNDDSIRNQDLKDDEGDTDPTACMIVDVPLKTSNHQTHHQKWSQSRNRCSFHHSSIQHTMI